MCNVVSCQTSVSHVETKRDRLFLSSHPHSKEGLNMAVKKRRAKAKKAAGKPKRRAKKAKAKRKVKRAKRKVKRAKRKAKRAKRAVKPAMEMPT